MDTDLTSRNLQHAGSAMPDARATELSTPAHGIDAFRDRHGLFTMVAIDQRESLRHMIGQARGGRSGPDEAADTRDSAEQSVTDGELAAFKTQVARALTEDASGILLDRPYGADAARQANCPVILAADLLAASVPGGPVDIAAIDDDVTTGVVDIFGASALKLLVPWHPRSRQHAVDLSNLFMDRCRRWGIPGLVEGVVRPRDGSLVEAEQFSEALVQAAEDLAQTKPDLYKTEVVFTSSDDQQLAVDTARAVTAAMACPWVVLSSGVPGPLFGAAAAAAVSGGASGFLAGRAVWAASLTAPNVESHLRTDARRNFTELVNHVWSIRP